MCNYPIINLPSRSLSPYEIAVIEVREVVGGNDGRSRKDGEEVLNYWPSISLRNI